MSTDLSSTLNQAVKVCHVYTPAPGFNGFRHRIRFANGEAAFREPVVSDFNDDQAWLAEKEAFDQLVDVFRKMPGYEVRMKAEVELPDIEE